MQQAQYTRTGSPQNSQQGVGMFNAGSNNSSNPSSTDLNSFFTNLKKRWKLVAGVAAVLVLVLGTGVGLYLSQQEQDVRQQAYQVGDDQEGPNDPCAVTECTPGATACNGDISFECVMFSSNCSPQGVWRADQGDHCSNNPGDNGDDGSPGDNNDQNPNASCGSLDQSTCNRRSDCSYYNGRCLNKNGDRTTLASCTLTCGDPDGCTCPSSCQYSTVGVGGRCSAPKKNEGETCSSNSDCKSNTCVTVAAGVKQCSNPGDGSKTTLGSCTSQCNDPDGCNCRGSCVNSSANRGQTCGGADVPPGDQCQIGGTPCRNGYECQQLAGAPSGTGQCVRSGTGGGSDGSVTFLSNCSASCSDPDGCSCSNNCVEEATSKGNSCGGEAPVDYSCSALNSTQCGNRGDCVFTGGSCYERKNANESCSINAQCASNNCVAVQGSVKICAPQNNTNTSDGIATTLFNCSAICRDPDGCNCGSPCTEADSGTDTTTDVNQDQSCGGKKSDQDTYIAACRQKIGSSLYSTLSSDCDARTYSRWDNVLCDCIQTRPPNTVFEEGGACDVPSSEFFCYNGVIKRCTSGTWSNDGFCGGSGGNVDDCAPFSPYECSNGKEPGDVCGQGGLCVRDERYGDETDIDLYGEDQGYQYTCKCEGGGAGGGDITPPPEDVIDNQPGDTSPEGTPPPGAMCVDIQINRQGDKSANDPITVGDKISLTCGQVGGAQSYDFRYAVWGSGQGWMGQNIRPAGSARQSESFIVNSQGQHIVQCRPCFGPNQSNCMQWEDPGSLTN